MERVWPRRSALGQQTCDGDGDRPAEAGEHGVQTNDHDCMWLTRGLRPTVVATGAPPPTIDLRLSLTTTRLTLLLYAPLPLPYSNEQGLLNSLTKLRT